MKKPLKVIVESDFPSLDSFKKKLEDNEIYVKYFDGHILETQRATFTMLDGKIIREPKELDT